MRQHGANTVPIFDATGQPIEGPTAGDIANAEANAASAAADKTAAETARDEAVAAAASLDTANFIRNDINSVVNAFTKWLDGQQVQIGTDGDLLIYHDGTDNFLDNVNGTVFVRQLVHGGDIEFGGEDAGGVYRVGFRLEDGSFVRLFFNGAERARTTQTGVSVKGEAGTNAAEFGKATADNDSFVRLWDETAGVYRTVKWDDSAQAFMVEDTSGAFHSLLGLGQGQTWQEFTVGVDRLQGRYLPEHHRQTHSGCDWRYHDRQHQP